MEKGLLIVHTGEGKGKTTAALGMALRAAGQGMRVLILQFIKGRWRYGELDAMKAFPNVHMEALGLGFTWRRENLDEDRGKARAGWERAVKEIGSGKHDLIVLDELNNVLAYNFLPLDAVIQTLRNRPENLHIVVTGRNAPEELIEMADLVTEMRLIKHPYREQGIRAQKGIEF